MSSTIAWRCFFTGNKDNANERRRKERQEGKKNEGKNEMQTHASNSSPTIKTPSPGSSFAASHACWNIPGEGLERDTSHDRVGGVDRRGRMESDERVLTV